MTIQSNLYFWEYTCDLYNWYIIPQPFLNCKESIPPFRVFFVEKIVMSTILLSVIDETFHLI